MNSMSNKFLLILFCWFSLIGFAQPNYNVNIYNNPYPCNLFFHVGGPPSKPVNIVDSSGTLIYSHDFGLKGWAWQVNENNKITFFDRQSKGWFIMDSLENITDSVYCQNGYVADNHDFIALPNGNYIFTVSLKSTSSTNTSASLEGYIGLRPSVDEKSIFKIFFNLS